MNQKGHVILESCSNASNVPDVESGIEDISLLQTVQLDLAVTHLVVDTLQLIVQLQLLPFELAVLLLVPLFREQQ